MSSLKSLRFRDCIADLTIYWCIVDIRVCHNVGARGEAVPKIILDYRLGSDPREKPNNI